MDLKVRHSLWVPWHFFISLASGPKRDGHTFIYCPRPCADVLFSRATLFIFLLFLDQILLWHSGARKGQSKKPIGYLILLANGIHNFIGGMGIGAAIMSDVRIGMTAWLAALLHELPQELGDFGILVDSGWSKGKALMQNFMSALTFPIGGLFVYYLSNSINISLLIPFAAGNFLYCRFRPHSSNKAALT